MPSSIRFSRESLWFVFFNIIVRSPHCIIFFSNLIMRSAFVFSNFMRLAKAYFLKLISSRQAATTTTPAPTPVGCEGSIPNHDKYVVAVVEIKTNQAMVGQVWDSVNEMSINTALSKSCQPPITVGYFGSASSSRASILFAAVSALLAMAVSARN